MSVKIFQKSGTGGMRSYGLPIPKVGSFQVKMEINKNINNLRYGLVCIYHPIVPFYHENKSNKIETYCMVDDLLYGRVVVPLRHQNNKFNREGSGGLMNVGMGACGTTQAPLPTSQNSQSTKKTQGLQKWKG
jgi:hypothetical protein